VKKLSSQGDPTIERQLREALVARLAPEPSEAAQNACLDPETFAAWADGELDARERAVVEAHAADCSRCQAMLAAMIRTTESGAEATPWWRLPALKWLAPLAAAATALVVWAIVPTRVQPRDRVVTEANVPSREPVEPETDVQPRKPVVPESSAQPGRRDVPDASMQRHERAGVEPGETHAPAPSLGRLSESQAQTPPPPADVKQPAFDKNEIPPPAAKARSSPADSQAAPSAASPLDAATALPRNAGEAPRQAAPSKAAPELFARALPEKESIADIVSANPGSRWRILPSGAVERSTDGGSTWQTQQTGVSVTLTAGASPLPSVCWLVGPSGIVLLQTDGRSWHRIAFPEPADLMSVRAIDDKAATVTTVDGRMFSTANGGVTWTRRTSP
jgi:hypothetical protein